MRCKYCQDLSIETLFQIAKKEIEKNAPYNFRDNYNKSDNGSQTDGPGNVVFPQKAYYSHQPTYSALKKSAETGCDLCQVIYNECEQKGDLFGSPDGEKFHSTWGRLCLEREANALATDVRIALEAHDILFLHIKRLRDKDFGRGATVLDTLMVQIGSLQNLYQRPALGLPMSIPRDCPLAKDPLISVRRLRIDPTTASEGSFEIANEWLRDCGKTHSSCSQLFFPTNLPTRLLNIAYTSSSTVPFIRLMDASTISTAKQFLALSHCWGGEIALKLTKSNYDTLRSEVLWQDLPANFQDAVTITQKLGFNYLWIDSLCIIQDSREDWATESGKMHEIYRAAYATIAASSSAGSTSGILTRQVNLNRFEIPLDFTMNISRVDDSKGCAFLSRDRINVPIGLYGILTHEPLSRRAWAFQERALSRRVLYFGSDMLYWQCPEASLSADGLRLNSVLAGNIYPILSHYLLTNELRKPEQGENLNMSIFHEWRSIISTYSQGNLTKSSDKLPAISGVAVNFQKMTGATYIAGFFDADIQRSLLWQCIVQGCRKISTRKPSWSWISTHGKVSYWSLKTPPRHPNPYKCSLQLLDHSVDLVDVLNPFGGASQR